MLPRQAVISLLLTVFVPLGNASFCNRTQYDTLKERYVSRQGRVMNVTLHWASDPARAASALLAVILRGALGYQRVYLRESPYLDLRTFATKVPHNKTRHYDEVILALSLAWEPGQNPYWAPNQGAMPGLAGPRLEEFGASSIPVRQRLHVHVAKHLRARSECLNITQWSFYTNVTTLKLCGFTDIVLSDKKATIYELDSVETTITKLREFAEALHFDIKRMNRTFVFQMLQTGNHSFLFVDYDIWSDHQKVSTILEPFCSPSVGSTCLLKSSSSVGVRVGDVSLLIENAPALMQLVHNFTISNETIREILKLESTGKQIEEAASEWASRHNTIAEWNQQYDPSEKDYEIAIFYCRDDPDNKKYDLIIRNLSNGIIKDMYKTMFRIRPVRYLANCSDVNFVKNKINHYLSLGIRQRLIGAIVGSLKNITYVAKTVDGVKVPVLFYDAAAVDADSTISTWLTTGRSRHLALALRHFALGMKWTRIAVLSESTDAARRFVNDIKAAGNVAVGDHYVPLDLSKTTAENILHKLRNGHENAHIILVNTNYKDAATILAAAVRLGMSSTTEYAWIVREWRPDYRTVDIRHFTFSFWCRCGNDPSKIDGIPELRTAMDELYRHCTWPPHIATLGDALFTLLSGFKSALIKCPQIRDDLRNEEAVKAFGRGITDAPIQGLTQNLTYKKHSLEETVVFVDEWRGHAHSHLGRWRVNAATGKVVIEQHQRDAYPLKDQPHDGSSRCIVTSGDAYLPTCRDWEWGTALVLIMLAPPTLILVYRVLQRRLREHEKKIICEVLAQRQQRAAALSAGYLIDRSALTLRNELGSGRFGYVRLAWLRLPGHTPRFVAAKALREDQDENEILHEACILASLHHENIIRLVGVCVDKDPPLVLMEIAFFGDLLQYLRDRRYLAEGLHSEISQTDKGDEEASHVSAEALTRLARQAASALGYLALRGVIHRDLRASNCLVDANRSLKLADFGLARETKASGTDGTTEYACRRRGLFPVLWMAPESLTHGVFSTASDMWAFGVLVFELVTLGARPYGDMSPLRVMQYVAAGGKPLMPRDATPQTLALTRICWQRESEQRPTAANVVAYLAERPYALRPAFDGDNEEPIDTDSGCGESPISELLPC